MILTFSILYHFEVFYKAVFSLFNHDYITRLIDVSDCWNEHINAVRPAGKHILPIIHDRPSFSTVFLKQWRKRLLVL